MKKLLQRNLQSPRHRLGALLALTMLLLDAASPLAQTEKPLWAGQSGGFQIRWTSADLAASPASTPSNLVFSAKRNADRDFAAFKQENFDQGAEMPCSYEQTLGLLSVVGSLVSYRLDEFSFCGGADGGPGWAHPSVNINYRVVDLNMPTRQIKLTLFFSEGDILKALLADPLVKKALAGSQTKQPPKTIAALVKMFVDEGLSMQPVTATSESPEGCEYIFPDDVLTQFAFHHLENNKVAVRLSLEPSSGACRTGHAQLGLLLPIPASLKPALEAAQAAKEGFLMKDAKSLSGNRNTVFKYEVKPSRRKRSQ